MNGFFRSTAPHLFEAEPHAFEAEPPQQNSNAKPPQFTSSRQLRKMRSCREPDAHPPSIIVIYYFILDIFI